MNELEINDVVMLKTIREFIKGIAAAAVTDLALYSSSLEKIYVLEDLIEIKKNEKNIKSKLSKEKQDRVQSIELLSKLNNMIHEKIKQMEEKNDDYETRE